MPIILMLLLLLPSQAIAEEQSKTDYCNEIAAVLQESVRNGTLTYKEAGVIMGSCFKTEKW